MKRLKVIEIKHRHDGHPVRQRTRPHQEKKRKRSPETTQKHGSEKR